VVWLGGVEGFFIVGNDVGFHVGATLDGLLVEDACGLLVGIRFDGFHVVGFFVVGLYVSGIMLVHHLPLQPISQLSLFTLHHSPP
jgi:hypothetical protein